MVGRQSRVAHRELLALAQGQGSYFTAKQAARLGYLYPHLDYHVRVGNFERSGHGVYRLPEIPMTEHDDLVRHTFWSRNRADEPQAVVSHGTALAIYDLSDLISETVHLTVPGTFRKAMAKGTTLHRDRLDAGDIAQREGFRVTTPLRTLVDVAADNTISEEQLHRAVAEALEQGLVRKSSLTAALKHRPAAGRLSQALETVR